MLLGTREKNPRVMIRIGYFFMLAFFAMNLLPHPTSSFGDGLFDGVRGALMGIGGSLLLWATYLNGQRRRAEKK
jgi:uncharacterized membrane protein YccC